MRAETAFPARLVAGNRALRYLARSDSPRRSMLLRQKAPSRDDSGVDPPGSAFASTALPHGPRLYRSRVLAQIHLSTQLSCSALHLKRRVELMTRGLS